MSLAIRELRAYAEAKRREGIPCAHPGVTAGELEALCDLVDAAREVERVRTNGDFMRVEMQIGAALNRLDGEDE